MIIPRPHHVARIRHLLDHNPVVAILGARQVGKTTLAGMVESEQQGPVSRFDLEDLDDLARLDEPKLALQSRQGLVIIDEIQRRPELFPVLRVLVDRPRSTIRFLILGSASPDLLRQTSETLAGRIVYHDLGGFALAKVGDEKAHRLWLRGGFPRSYLAPTIEVSNEWRQAFVRSFLERDIPQLGIQIPGTTLHRFWRMLAHYHAQTWNGAELARAFGISASTVRRYLDILTGALVVGQLQPWHENIGKRQVRSPKVYIADTGLLHTLLGLESQDDLESHPKVGASWETFVIQEIRSRLGARPEQCYFWAAHSGAELDLLVMQGRQRLGFEIKRTTAPKSTKSLHAAQKTLRLDKLCLVHAGDHSFMLTDEIEAVSFSDLDRITDDRG
jgi:predicted AAA+ superfamily ATPase